MRLINTTTLELKTAYGYGTPLYAILSHTWGDDEFLFEHLQAGITQHQKDTPSRGLSKILETCQRAKNDGLEYAWVDTCCIDKSSSAELSEAINSMFRWYEDSAACYIYLEDVSNRGRQGGVVNISHSRWFRRGWTLQELIAPYGATFFDKDWNEIGTRTEISEHIVAITGIDNAILERQHAPVDNIDVRSPVGRTGTMYRCGYCNDPKTLLSMMQQHSVGARMHWAARRATTRQEDTAYCLLGLFGINMPLLYGEGDKAFARLQGEIVRRYPADQSILAWLGYDGVFAQSPSDFRLKGNVLVHQPRWQGEIKIAQVPVGVEVDVLLIPQYPHGRSRLTPRHRRRRDKLFLAVLDCQIHGQTLPRLAILVKRLQSQTYVRLESSAMALINTSDKSKLVEKRWCNDSSSIIATFSHWAELSLEFALEDAVSQRIVLTDCDPFDVLLRNRNGWTTPPSSVAHIEILPAFPTFISSPQLIETPTGNITFGPSLAVEPLPMKIQSIFEYRFVEIEGIIYLSRVGSNGFLIIYGKRYPRSPTLAMEHVCAVLSWQEFQEWCSDQQRVDYWMKRFGLSGEGVSVDEPDIEVEFHGTKMWPVLALAPEARNEEFGVHVSFQLVKFLGREDWQLFVKSLDVS